MNKYSLFCLIVLLSIFSTISATELRKIIDENNNQYIKLFNAGDADGLSQLFTEDALYLMDGFSIIKGRKAIAKQLKIEMSAGSAKITLNTLDIYHDKTTITEVGTWVVTIVEDSTEIIIPGNYLVVWQLQKDGRWMIYKDVINYSGNHKI
ncbi:MAG: hypothetical protein ACI9N9_001795 [Enterobacterales bacterium]|jgi:uncharacterized protein (TIGR02246 family)